MKDDDVFGFSTALSLAKQGKGIQCRGWNGKGMSVHVQRPDEGSKMTAPYLYLQTEDGARFPWVASQNDLFHEEWMVAE